MLALAAAWLLLDAAPSSAERPIPPSLIKAGACRRPETEYCRKLVELYESQSKALAWIVVDHAETDADAAMAKGDDRLFGVYGYSEIVPELERDWWLPNGCGVRMIEGTSDYNADPDFAERPRAYAERYNRHVLAESHCLQKQPTRIGMAWRRWSNQAAPALVYAAEHSSMYSYVWLGCDKTGFSLQQMRLATQARPRTLEVGSGAVAETVRARMSLPNRSLGRHDFFYLDVRLPRSSAVIGAFAESGRFRFGDEAFDALSDEERQSVRVFLKACRALAY